MEIEGIKTTPEVYEMVNSLILANYTPQEWEEMTPTERHTEVKEFMRFCGGY